MLYIVPIVYTGLSNFTVEADNPEQAKERAKEKFKNGADETMLGNEYEEIERVGEPEIDA